MAGLALMSQHKAEVPGPHGDWLYTFVRGSDVPVDPAAAAVLKVWRIAVVARDLICHACRLSSILTVHSLHAS